MKGFAVIFDMDGVLVDSVNAITKAFDKILSEDYGIKESTKWHIKGLSLKDHAEGWKRAYGIDINLGD